MGIDLARRAAGRRAAGNDVAAEWGRVVVTAVRRLTGSEGGAGTVTSPFRIGLIIFGPFSAVLRRDRAVRGLGRELLGGLVRPPFARAELPAPTLTTARNIFW